MIIQLESRKKSFFSTYINLISFWKINYLLTCLWGGVKHNVLFSHSFNVTPSSPSGLSLEPVDFPQCPSCLGRLATCQELALISTPLHHQHVLLLPVASCQSLQLRYLLAVFLTFPRLQLTSRKAKIPMSKALNHYLEIYPAVSIVEFKNI